MAASRYLRFPDLRVDILAFVADDDVWLAPADGGRAWRISADQAAAATPRLSADGQLVAWTSWRDGPAEIYLAGTQDGGSARVSYWSNDTTAMRGWGPDGEILALTGSELPFPRSAWAYAIPVTDGSARFSQHRRLPFGPVADVCMADGATALLTASVGKEPAFWKRYRGGRAGRLWVSEPGAEGPGPFRRLLADLAAQFSCPMLVGGRLAFISDHEGIGNLYSCALDGTDLRRHTDSDDFYVRNASSDGNRVVYQRAGDLWLLAGLGQDVTPERIDVRLGSPASGRATKLISADDRLDDLDCDLTGQASVVEVRGTVHWLAHRDGPARALSAIPGPAARLPRVLGDTGQAVWVVEVDGVDALEVGSTDGTDGGQPHRRLAAGKLGWVADLVASPDGTVVAAAAQDGGLFLVDIASGAVTELARSDNGAVRGLSFAPDSAWLAWSESAEDPMRRIRLARLSDQHVTDVTDGRFTDTDPVFTLDGLYLAFLSRRTFDPVYDAHVFDLSFPFGSRPYLLTLAAATPSPFGPLVGGRPVGGAKDDAKPADNGKGARATASGQGASVAAAADGPGADGPGETAADETANDESGSDKADSDKAGADKAGADKADSDKSGADKVKPVVIDLDGLGARIVQLPVPESKYRSLHPVDGGLAWLRDPLAGNLGESGARLGEARHRPALEHFDIKRAKCTELKDEVSWFDPSGDGTRLAVYDHGQLMVVPANRKADSDNPDDQCNVDLTRARFLAEPAALWRTAFGQAGRVVRHEYWIQDMAEVDWDAVLDQYRPLLDRVGTSEEFADVLHEVIAELGSSHAYITPAGGSGSTGHLVGLLGVDLAPSPDGWRIARILPGEASDPRAKSPLEAPGTEIGPGDTLVAIDGQPVDPEKGPGPLLVGTAGKPVELTVLRAADGEQHRAVVIPLADERRLRYQDWVAGRRRLVRELSDGRLGYLHVPDMQSEGWSDFHRDLRQEMHREGLIFDVRANRGGHTSQLIIEKVARRIIGWDIGRNSQPTSYPGKGWGPVVALADEASGSDGDIVTAAVRLMGIGQVVGTRTWGGVIGIDGWHELVDGTAVTVPKYSFWFRDLGWGVENYGVDPDVEVVISPDDWAAGNDVQLGTAVTLALASLAEHPAATPPSVADRPSRRRPVLPPRSAG